MSQKRIMQHIQYLPRCSLSWRKSYIWNKAWHLLSSFNGKPAIRVIKENVIFYIFRILFWSYFLYYFKFNLKVNVSKTAQEKYYIVEKFIRISFWLIWKISFQRGMCFHIIYFFKDLDRIIYVGLKFSLNSFCITFYINFQKLHLSKM